MREMLTIAVVLLVLLGTSLDSFCEVPEHYVTMYSKEPFLEVEQRFYPEDKIYAVVDFVDIEKGTYNLTAHWISPKGKVVTKRSYVFTIEADNQDQQVYFSLELHSKGAMSQIMGGGEYSEGVYGEWKVVVYCNNEKLTPLSFEITESVL